MDQTSPFTVRYITQAILYLLDQHIHLKNWFETPLKLSIWLRYTEDQL